MKNVIRDHYDIKNLPQLTPNELKAAREEAKRNKGPWLIDSIINSADTLDQPQTARAKLVVSKVKSFLFTSYLDKYNGTILDDWIDDAVIILDALEETIDEWELIENAKPRTESK